MASRRWSWALAAATVAPLLTPLYNRIDPTLLGVPFFYWYQLACAALALVIIAAAHLATRRSSGADR